MAELYTLKDVSTLICILIFVILVEFLSLSNSTIIIFVISYHRTVFTYIFLGNIAACAETYSIQFILNSTIYNVQQQLTT